MGFFDDILIPPESLQQPAKLYPDFKCFSSGVQFGLITFVHHISNQLHWSRADCDCSWSSCSCWAVSPSLAAASVTKQNKFGFGSTRRMRGPTTSTWTKERRSVFGWRMRSLWIRRRQARPPQRRTRRLNRGSRRRHQQRTAGRRKRRHTLWL